MKQLNIQLPFYFISETFLKEKLQAIFLLFYYFKNTLKKSFVEKGNFK